MRGRNRSTSILRGLPGSGKSTWAQNWASDPAGTWPHCVISLDAGWDVVADAQHANPEYANELARLATRHGAIWRTEDFDVPLDELLRQHNVRALVVTNDDGTYRGLITTRMIAERYIAATDAQDRKSTRLNSSHEFVSRMPSSA